MRRAMTIAVALSAALAAVLPARGRPVVRTASLPDGTELVFARVENAPQASFRYVVRAGASSDPDRHAGLAHLLEHLIFHGTIDVSESELADAIRRHGGTVNAFTSADSTWSCSTRRPELFAG